MAKSSLISDLLKSPSQIRQEEQEALRQRGLERAALISNSPTSGSLFGGLRGFAAQQAAQVDTRTDQMRRGIMGALGMDSRSANERQATQQQQAMRSINTGNLESMKAQRQRLVDSGVNPLVIERLDNAIKAEEDRQFARTQAEEQNKRLDAQLKLQQEEFKLEQSKFEAEKAIGEHLGEFDLETEEGLNSAVSFLMSKGKYGEATRLKNAYAEKQSAMQADIQYFAENFTGGDMAAAFDLYTQAKREGTGTKLAYQGLEERYEKARARRKSLLTSHRALDTLESGRVITGSFANTRKGAEKFYQSVLNGMGIGVDEDEAVARTELLMSQVYTLAGELLASGMFGTGTGISERDLQTAREIAGGEISLTPEGMKLILEINAKMMEQDIKSYNESLERYNDGFWRQSPISKENYILDVPERRPKEATFAGQWEQAPKAQNANGDIIGFVDGAWVNENGQPVESN